MFLTLKSCLGHISETAKRKSCKNCRKLILDGSLVGGAGILSDGVIFNLGPARVCSPAIIETYFS